MTTVRQVRAELIRTITGVEPEPSRPVAADSVILLLESLKMETSVPDDHVGTVTNIAVAAADVVRARQLLTEV